MPWNVSRIQELHPGSPGLNDLYHLPPRNPCSSLPRAGSHPHRLAREPRGFNNVGEDAALTVYKGVWHGLCVTLKNQVNVDLFAFGKA